MKASFVLAMLIAFVITNQVEQLPLVTDVKDVSYHYEDPWTNRGEEPQCLDGEIPNLPVGQMGTGCYPIAKGDKCPTDVPPNTTAVGYALITDNVEKFCALVCRGWTTGTCPSGASCQTLPSQTVPDNEKVAICLYDDHYFDNYISVIEQ